MIDPSLTLPRPSPLSHTSRERGHPPCPSPLSLSQGVIEVQPPHSLFSHEVVDGFPIDREPCCPVGHDALPLSGSDLGAQVGLAALAEDALRLHALRGVAGDHLHHRGTTQCSGLKMEGCRCVRIAGIVHKATKALLPEQWRNMCVCGGGWGGCLEGRTP